MRRPRECKVFGIPFPECKSDLVDGQYYVLSCADWLDGMDVFKWDAKTGDFQHGEIKVNEISSTGFIAYTLPDYNGAKEKADALERETADIFQAWNEAKVIVHGKLNDVMRKSAKKALKNYSLNEILQGIRQYGIVVNRPKSKFTHRWALNLFLSQDNALPRFIDSSCLTTYAPAPETPVNGEFGGKKYNMIGTR